jgi:hypothetical protein
MSWLHSRWKRRVALLVAGALDPTRAAAARAHALRCPKCAQDLAALQRVWQAFDSDPVSRAEPPVSLEALAQRVARRIDEQQSSGHEPHLWPRSRLLPVALAATALFAALAWHVWWRLALPGFVTRPTQTIEVPGEMLDRMERRQARESAARYLTEARDVLVTVAGRPAYCTRRERRVDVSDEARRSRELLVRRALLVDAEAPEVASARGVLGDVEQTLREVAALDPCSEPRALAELKAELARSRLLLKIDLVSRELVG